MTLLTLFPKPSQIKPKPLAVRIYRDGREVCNQLTKEGRDIYEGRKRKAWERQAQMCCLFGHINSCPGKLNWSDTTFDHEVPRGHGGGSQDDRIEVVDKKTGKVLWQNGAAHARCNYLKGSRRIKYNAAHNDALPGGGSNGATDK